MTTIKGNVELKFGSEVQLNNLSISTENMTVFVGPNNSGKSLVLKEIERFVRREMLNASYQILTKVEQYLTDVDEFVKMLLKYITSTNSGLIEIHVFNANSGDQAFRFDPQTLRATLSDERNQRPLLDLLKLFTVRLDGITRFNFTNSVAAVDLLQPTQNLLTALFKDDAAREEISKFTFEAFGYHFVIDPTGMQQLRIRLSKVAPADIDEEQGLSSRARAFHQQALPVESFSEGVRATLGILMPVMCGDYKIVLLDEPEAFLHPPLARRLGKKLAQVSKERESSLFVSTHSAEFLMGCVEAGVGINLVRMSYGNNVSTITSLSPDELLPLMRDPLLRSTDTLSALFHKCAIITESDIDRVFYQEINNRLMEADKIAAEDCAFLNAQNWQTIHQIIRPLRRLGIPSAAIVDVDVLLSGGDSWCKLLDACGVPDTMSQTILTWRETVETYLLNTSPQGVERSKRRQYVKKNGGVSLLTSVELDTAKQLLSTLANYGLFVVPYGEVECWLSDLGNDRHGSNWVVPMFESMGSDPNSPDYMRPPTPSDDVWAFMEQIAEYVNTK